MLDFTNIGIDLGSFNFVLVTALVFARSLGCSLFLPVLGGGDFPKIVRIVLAVVLTILVVPYLIQDSNVQTKIGSGNVKFWESTFLLVIEFILGSVLSLSLRIFFESVYIAGEVIGRIGGISVAGSFDISLGEETSVSSSFLLWSAYALFIVFGGLESFIDGYLNILSIAPLGEAFDPYKITEVLICVLSGSFALAFKIVCPVIIVNLSLYLVIGFIGRVFPQFNSMQVAFSCSSLLSLSILTMAIGTCCYCFQDGTIWYLKLLTSFND